MVNTIRINGVVLGNKDTIAEVYHEEIEIIKEKLGELNRETRRSGWYKNILCAIGIVGTFGLGSSVVKAEAFSSPDSTGSIFGGLGSYILDAVKDKMLNSPIDTPKENSLIWQLNQYMSKTLFTTFDFFKDVNILGIYHIVWYVIMAFMVIIISKKGLDMIKARVIGATSQGATEFIIRLLVSCLLSFFSLDIISIGIHFSNLATSVIMGNMSKGTMHFANTLSTILDGGIGSFFWLISFILLFCILAVRYWARQINLVVLGCLAPVANMAWVTDGGSMLSTLVKEVSLSLSTPIVQSIVLGIGTTILTQVGGSNDVGFFNSVFIGISTLAIMIITPDFLRKFTTGSANPFSWAFKTFLQIKGMPLSLIKAMK
jgi:hypothetical protein